MNRATSLAMLVAAMTMTGGNLLAGQPATPCQTEDLAAVKGHALVR